MLQTITKKKKEKAIIHMIILNRSLTTITKSTIKINLKMIKRKILILQIKNLLNKLILMVIMINLAITKKKLKIIALNLKIRTKMEKAIIHMLIVNLTTITKSL